MTAPSESRGVFGSSGGRVSASRLRLYRLCGKAWDFRYAQRLPSKEAGAPAMVGRAVHLVIEEASNSKPGEIVSQDDLTKTLARLAAEGDIDHEHVQGAREVIEKIENLRLEDAVEGYGAEHHFELDLDGVKLHGYIDFVRYGSADRTHIEITDWKTGFNRVENPEYDEQVGVYLLWARREFPEAKRITFQHSYLALQETGRVEWTQELDDWHVTSIQASVKSMARGYVPARVGKQCTWCDYTDRCEAFQRYVAEPVEAEPSGVAALTEEELLKRRRDAKQKAKLSEAHAKVLDEEIARRIDAEKRSLRGGGLKARWGQRGWRKLEARDLLTISQEAGLSIEELLPACKPSVKELGKILKGNEEALDVAARFIQQGHTRYLEVRNGTK